MLEHKIRLSLISFAFVVSLAFAIEAGTFEFSAKHAPFYAGWTVTLLMGLMVVREIRRVIAIRRSGSVAAVGRTLEHMEYEEEVSSETARETVRYVAWLFVYLGAMALVGFKAATVLYLLVFLLREARMRPWKVGVTLAAVFVGMQAFERLLGFDWPHSLVL